MTLHEVIPLRHEDPSAVTEWYVRGHIPAADALASVQAHLEGEAEEGTRDHVPALAFGRHIYARWGIGMIDGEVRVRLFYPDVKPGQGAFKVTAVFDADDSAATKAAREAERAHAADLEAWIQAIYPEATEIEGHGYPPGKGRVRFRLPGLEGEVSRAADKATAWVQTRDLEAFRRLYKAGGEQRAPRFAEFVAAIGRKE